MASDDLAFNLATLSSVNSGSSNTSSPGKTQPTLSRRQRKNNKTRLQQQESRNSKMTVTRMRKSSKDDESDKSSGSESGIGSQDSSKSDEVLNEDETETSDSGSYTKDIELTIAPAPKTTVSVRKSVYKHAQCPSHCLVRLHQLHSLDDYKMYKCLYKIILTEEQLIRNGFPVIYDPDKLVLDPLLKTSIKQKDIFCNDYMLKDQVYFKNWNPKNSSFSRRTNDGSPDNSSEDEDIPGIIKPARKDFFSHVVMRAHNEQMLQKICQRCNQSFVGLFDQYCWHHPETRMSKNGRICVECGKSSREPGCNFNAHHVWSGYLPGLNGPCSGFVQTMPSDKSVMSAKVFALDCEMCYTHNGLELAQVTLVDLHGEIVYNAHVFPVLHILDYNTRFSGITSNNYRPTKSLDDVQRDLCAIIDEDTILIGHGLENDLRALRIVHKKVIDTSLLFANEKKRTSLKVLALTRLGRYIQVPCHNAAEDARTTLELVLRFIHLKT